MRVVVATLPEVSSAAHLALRAEGVKHETHIVKGMFGYWELLSDLWKDGEGFILLEYDVTPWPGALQKLIECPEHWCVHKYPYGEPPQLLWALGACKFSSEFIEAIPEVPQLRWEQLDHFPRGILNSMGKPHIHEPAFAHARLKNPGE